MRGFQQSSSTVAEVRFRFRFRFWIVCSKAASSGINVTQGSITRNDSMFIWIHGAYIREDRHNNSAETLGSHMEMQRTDS